MAQPGARPAAEQCRRPPRAKRLPPLGQLTQYRRQRRLRLETSRAARLGGVRQGRARHQLDLPRKLRLGLAALHHRLKVAGEVLRLPRGRAGHLRPHPRPQLRGHALRAARAVRATQRARERTGRLAGWPRSVGEERGGRSKLGRVEAVICWVGRREQGVSGPVREPAGRRNLRQSFFRRSPLGMCPAASCSPQRAACRACFASHRERAASWSGVQLCANPYASTTGCCSPMAACQGRDDGGIARVGSALRQGALPAVASAVARPLYCFPRPPVQHGRCLF